MRSYRKMKNPILDQKGIALVSTLLLMVLGFGIVAILFRLSTQETKLTRLEQGYSSTLDAAKAGADLFIDMVQRGSAVPPQPANNGPVNAFGTSPNSNCLNVKMNNTTSAWAAQPGWAGCPSSTSTTKPSAISTDPTDSPDVTLTLNSGAGPNSGAVPCTVNIKVINNYKSGWTGVTNPYNCQYGCYYYTVISRAQTVGSNEYAQVFFVYRYDAPPP